jgi:hypothetical protein
MVRREMGRPISALDIPVKSMQRILGEGTIDASKTSAWQERHAL